MDIYSIKRVKRSSLTTEVAQAIHQSIMSGVLSPGTRLIEIDLAAQLGVSRGPLREALRILESEGIVESIPGRGTYVRKISEKDIAEVYSMRSILEKEAVRLAAKHASKSQIEGLERDFQEMLAVVRVGDLQRVVDLDVDFHIELWEASNHKLLIQMLMGIISQIRIYLAVQTSLYEDLAAGVADHGAILECIKNDKGEGAAALMEKHLSHAAQVVAEFAHEQVEESNPS